MDRGKEKTQEVGWQDSRTTENSESKVRRKEPPNGSIPACSLFLLSIENSEYAEGRNFDLSLTLSILSFHPKVRLTSTSQQKKKKIEEQKYKYEYEYPYIEIHIRQETRGVQKQGQFTSGNSNSEPKQRSKRFKRPEEEIKESETGLTIPS